MSSAASAHRAKLASLVGNPLNPHITGSSNLHCDIIRNYETQVNFKYDCVTYIWRLNNMRGTTETLNYTKYASFLVPCLASTHIFITDRQHNHRAKAVLN